MQYYLENHLKGFKLQNDSVEAPSFHSSQTVFLESQRNLAFVRSRYNTYPGGGVSVNSSDRPTMTLKKTRKYPFSRFYLSSIFLFILSRDLPT